MATQTAEIRHEFRTLQSDPNTKALSFLVEVFSGSSRVPGRAYRLYLDFASGQYMAQLVPVWPISDAVLFSSPADLVGALEADLAAMAAAGKLPL